MTIPTLRVAEVQRAGAPAWLCLAGTTGGRRLAIRLDLVTAWLLDESQELLVIHTRDGRYDLGPAAPVAGLSAKPDGTLATIEGILWDECVGATRVDPR